MSNFEIFPEKPPPSPPPPPHALDDLFTKVASLWFWTIFFVITSGLSISFLASIGSLLSATMMGRGIGFNAPGGGMYGDTMAFVLPVIHIAGMLANVGSWAFLYIYFTVYLLPAVILRDPNGVDDRRRRLAASALRRTYLLTLAAGIARLLPELLLYLTPALSRMML